MSVAPSLISKSLARITLTVQTGSEKGVTFQLLPPAVTIGRGADNDIALMDPKCSRRQAIIHLTDDGVQLEDASGRQTTIVNGEPITKVTIQDGDMIRVGETDLILKIDSPVAATALQSVPHFNTGISVTHPPTGLTMPPPLNPLAQPGFQSGPLPHQRQRTPPPSKEKQKRIRFYAIVAVMGVAAFWFINGSNKTKIKEPGIRSSQDVESDIKNADERFENLAQARQFKTPEEEIRYQEAHRHYLDGFRDYQNAQYATAMRSFETALAIDPDHALARHYHEIAARRRDEGIAAALQDGKIYRDRQMYVRCSATLQKVLVEVANADDLRFKEALSLKRECDLIQQRKD